MTNQEIPAIIGSALQDINKMKGEVQGVFDPQLKSINSTIQSYENKVDKCPNSIEALINNIKKIEIYGGRYVKTNNWAIQDIDNKISAEQYANSEIEALTENKKQQINQINADIDKISADLTKNLISQDEYKKKLVDYKQKLEVSKQELEQCQTRGFSKKQQILLIIILVVISIAITLMIKRSFKKKSRYLSSDQQKSYK